MRYYSYPHYDPDPAKQVIKTLSEQEILVYIGIGGKMKELRDGAKNILKQIIQKKIV